MVMAVNTGDGIYDDNTITRSKLFSENFRTVAYSACSHNTLINDCFHETQGLGSATKEDYTHSLVLVRPHPIHCQSNITIILNIHEGWVFLNNAVERIIAFSVKGSY